MSVNVLIYIISLVNLNLPFVLSEVVQMIVNMMGTSVVTHLTHHLQQHHYLFTIDTNTAAGRSIATHEPLGADALLGFDCGSLNRIIYSQ